jgi:hypothetical protein
MAWLRLYTEVKSDPKVHQLSANQFKTWIFCLILAKENSGVLPPISEIAFHLRMKPEVAETHLDRLVEVRLIDRNDNELRPHNWDDRQFISDDVTARVKKFREKGMKRFGNVACNAHETHQIQTQIQKQTTETPKPPKRASTNGFDFEHWFEEMYALDPKKKFKFEAQRSLASDVRIEDQKFRSTFESQWRSWAEYMSVDYVTKKSLLEWYDTEGWKDKIPKFKSKLDYQLEHNED